MPILVGAVTVYVAERQKRRTWSFYFWIAAGANALFVLGTFLVLIEGLICVVLAIPLFSVIGGLSGLAMGALCRRSNWSKQTTVCLAFLPLVLGGVEQNLPPPEAIGSEQRVIPVHAAPEQVWNTLLTAEDIRPDEIGNAWIYRIGVPLPTSAISQAANGEIVRHIKMGSGIHFDQVATEISPNQRVLWRYRFFPDSFPPRALDDHVRIGGKYFDVIDTEYTLKQLPAGTELRARMSFRVSTMFNWYARPLAEFLVGDFEEAALRFYARRAEASR